MSIIDYSKFHAKQTNYSNHAPFFPQNIFCVIAGSTGCGKTNLMENLLMNEGFLDYSKVYIYSSTLHQPTYQFLKTYYNNLENKIKKTYHKDMKIAYFFDGDDEIKNPTELDSKSSHIMVFDDVMNADQTTIKDYFCRGRHNNVNVFYLCQSLHKIAKHCIRENANVFILFHQDNKTLKYFHETHVSGDMEFKEFKQFCDGGWNKKYGFVVINIWEEPYCGRYITNYDTIYTPSKYIKIHKNT
jgi:ABC-type cobalamin/Fe3+-siderophores transport system ATPase subunit